jgi:hypothetical protein
MAKCIKLPHAQAVRRFERRAEAKALKAEAKAEAHRAEKRADKRARQDAARLVKIVHLRRALLDAARRPSLFTAKRLSAIAKNPQLPAEARVEAARLLTQWLFAEPQELLTPTVPHGRRRSKS